MSDIDKLLQDLKSNREVKKETIVPVSVEVETKKPFPWLNIGLITIILIMGVFLIRKSNNDPSPEPNIDLVVNVSEFIETQENNYSKHKGTINAKLAELVLAKTIVNREQLLKNTQAMMDQARTATLYKIDELDDKSIPPTIFTGKEEELAKYLLEKSKGFEGASK